MEQQIEEIREELKALLTETLEKLDAASMPPKLLDEREAGRYLGVSPGTMRHWRDAGKGPEFMRLCENDKIIRYYIGDLDSFITTHPRRREQAAS